VRVAAILHAAAENPVSVVNSEKVLTTKIRKWRRITRS
jgi:hypothetical protein